jgi:electron transfer flavoprotein alpha subunit
LIADAGLHGALARWYAAAGSGAAFVGGVQEVAPGADGLRVATPVFGGRLRLAQEVGGERLTIVTLADGADAAGLPDGPVREAGSVGVLALQTGYRRDEDPLAVKRDGDAPLTLATAECIVDVGYALRTRDDLDALAMPLLRELEALGARRVMLGGTRKVTEELQLLPLDRQIGQTGTRVNPVALLALGVSGAPQHVDYIGDRATVIAFNRDADAPLLTLNQRRAHPCVIPVVGDLRETLPRFLRALRESGDGG